MLRFIYLLARVSGFLVLAASAIATGVHATGIRVIEANRARYGALEQRIAADESALDETAGAVVTLDIKGITARQLERSYRFNDHRAALLELGQHSSKAEAEAYFHLSSFHTIDDLGLSIGIILLVSGLIKELCELPEGFDDSKVV